MAGKIVQELIPVSPINRKGYPSDVIYKFIKRIGRLGWDSLASQ